MMKRFAGLVLVLSAYGCGAGTEPFSILGDPTVSPPALALPIPNNQITSVVPFSPTSDGIELTSAFNTSLTVQAPAAGIVSATDATSVTLFHTAHFSTRVSKLNLVSPQVGRTVNAGDSVGTIPVAGAVHFTVLLDGTAVCPVSYLSPDARVNGIDARIAIPCTQ